MLGRLHWHVYFTKAASYSSIKAPPARFYVKTHPSYEATSQIGAPTFPLIKTLQIYFPK